MKYTKALENLKAQGYLVQEHGSSALVQKEYNMGGVFATIENKKGLAVITRAEACAGKLNWVLTIILFPFGLLFMIYWLLKKGERLRQLQFIVG